MEHEIHHPRFKEHDAGCISPTIIPVILVAFQMLVQFQCTYTTNQPVFSIAQPPVSQMFTSVSLTPVSPRPVQRPRPSCLLSWDSASALFSPHSRPLQRPSLPFQGFSARRSWLPPRPLVHVSASLQSCWSRPWRRRWLRYECWIGW